MPAVIVGSLVREKANFCTIAYCGIVHMDPPMISIECSENHLTTEGILEHEEFSVNIPSTDMAEITDYIGLNSGRDVDKSNLFDVFFGDLKNAPLIKEAPVNHACKLVKIVELAGSKELFIGEIQSSFVSDGGLSNDAPDVEKVNPLIYATSNKSYYSIGKEIGKAWNIGKGFKKG